MGGECWASALSGAGFKARYRVRFLGIQQNGPPCIVRFLADSSGRSMPLCLPSPLVQFLDLSELSRLDEYSPLRPSPEAAAGAGGDASAAPAAAGSGTAGPPGAVGGRRSQRPRAPSEGAVRAAATEPLRKPAAGRGGKRRLEAEGGAEGEAAEEEACARCLSTASVAGNEMLLCDGDGCPVGFHLRCLCPALTCVPQDDWLCPACSASRISLAQASSAGEGGEGGGESEEGGEGGEDEGDARPKGTSRTRKRGAPKADAAADPAAESCLACAGKHRPHTCERGGSL